MRILTLGLIVLIASSSGSAAQDEAAVAEDDVAVIKQSVDSYVDAFNRGDATALAAHWIEDGELVAPDGVSVQGRAQLEAQFKTYFQETANAKLELDDVAVEVMSPHVAVETGVSRTFVGDQEPEMTQYRAVHVKTADGWKIDSVREEIIEGPAPSHVEHLRALEWLVGSWEDVGEESTVVSNWRWTTNQNYLVSSFQSVADGEVQLEGTQIVGWDPSREVVRSWLFDSDGGFGVGLWSGEGNRWSVKMLQVLADGSKASSTLIYELVDDNRIQFQAIGRSIGGELLPNVGPIVVTRQQN